MPKQHYPSRKELPGTLCRLLGVEAMMLNVLVVGLLGICTVPS
jgi:hypothetical protein